MAVLRCTGGHDLQILAALEHKALRPLRRLRRQVADPQGQILEVTLDISYKYMENALTVTSNGLENVSTPNADHVASIVMNRQSAISLRNLLIQSLGDETL